MANHEPANGPAVIVPRLIFDSDDAYFEHLLSKGMKMGSCEVHLQDAYVTYSTNFMNVESTVNDLSELSSLPSRPEHVSRAAFDRKRRELRPAFDLWRQGRHEANREVNREANHDNPPGPAYPVPTTTPNPGANLRPTNTYTAPLHRPPTSTALPPNETSRPNQNPPMITVPGTGLHPHRIPAPFRAAPPRPNPAPPTSNPAGPLRDAAPDLLAAIESETVSFERDSEALRKAKAEVDNLEMRLGKHSSKILELHAQLRAQCAAKNDNKDNQNHNMGNLDGDGGLGGAGAGGNSRGHRYGGGGMGSGDFGMDMFHWTEANSTGDVFGPIPGTYPLPTRSQTQPQSQLRSHHQDQARAEAEAEAQAQHQLHPQYQPEGSRHRQRGKRAGRNRNSNYPNQEEGQEGNVSAEEHLLD